MSELRLLRAALLPVGLLALSACAPNYTLPTPDLPQPTAAVHLNVAPDWWRTFNDPVLDALIAEAFAASPTLERAVARVDAAQARLGISGSQSLPSLDAALSAGRTKRAESTNPQASEPVTLYQANLKAYWEIDLWGRIRNEVAAARADLTGASHARDAARLALAAQVAQGYFQLRGLDAQLEIARRTVVSRQESLNIRNKRFLGGMTSELDMRQAEAELAAAEAQVPDLVEAVARAEASLAILVGMSPARLNATGPDRGKALDTIPVPPEIPEGLPSDLLNRRPDIQEAEQGLRATQARVAAARTAWFPSIALTGALGGESLAFADLFKGSALAWNFAGSLAAPLFNGGLTAAQIDLASANERAAAAQYRDSVIRAFADLRSAFVAKRQAATRTVALEQAVRALRRQQRLATLRYDNGFSSYLEVLDAERALFDSELALVDARRAHLVAGVDLYRALGGGWTPE
jgi:multidrug efflux system outer membrane protein